MSINVRVVTPITTKGFRRTEDLNTIGENVLISERIFAQRQAFQPHG